MSSEMSNYVLFIRIILNRKRYASNYIMYNVKVLKKTILVLLKIFLLSQLDYFVTHYQAYIKRGSVQESQENTAGRSYLLDKQGAHRG